MPDNTAQELTPEPQPGLTRRRAIQRASLVTGAVVASPLIQSVTAPVFAASTGTKGSSVSFGGTPDTAKKAKWQDSVNVAPAAGQTGTPGGTVIISDSTGGATFSATQNGTYTTTLTITNFSSSASFWVQNPNGKDTITVTAAYSGDSQFAQNTGSATAYTTS